MKQLCYILDYPGATQRYKILGPVEPAGLAAVEALFNKIGGGNDSLWVLNSGDNAQELRDWLINHQGEDADDIEMLVDEDRPPVGIAAYAPALANPENVRRTNKAAEKMSALDYECYLQLDDLVRRKPRLFTSNREPQEELRELLGELDELLRRRQAWSEELARAACGRPPVPSGRLALPEE